MNRGRCLTPGFSLSALVLLARFVTAVTFATPTNVVSGAPITVKWATNKIDPTRWELQLVNIAMDIQIILSDNVSDISETISLQLPDVTMG